MKKILSLLVLLLTSMTMFAAEKTVWEGSQAISWNTDYFPGIQLDTYEVDDMKAIFSGLAKDDIIRLYTTTEYDSPQYVLKHKAGSDWSWTDLTVSVSEGVISYTVESNDIATWIADRGMVITGQAYTLTKITIETPGSGTEEPTTGTVIFEGSTTLDWGAEPAVSISLAADKFATAQAGNILKIEGTGTNEYTQVQVCINYPWKSSDSYTTLPINYEISADDLENIKANGMTIAGQQATITKVSLVNNDEPTPEPDPTTYPIVAWEGSQVINWGANPGTWQTIGRDKFTNAKAGDILRIAYSDVKANAQIALNYSTATSWELLPGTEIMTVDGLAKRVVLTQDMLDVILTGDLHISGAVFTLNKVEILDAATVKTLASTVSVNHNWIWESGEQPALTVNIQNNNAEAVNATVTLMLTTDKMVAIKNYETIQEIAANSSDVVSFNITDALTAGFYHATIIVNDETIRGFNFGYAPTEISSPADKQADFESFWQQAKEELATVEATDEPVLTKIESKSTAKRTVYLVEFKSVSNGDGNPETIRGYYCEPNDGKKHPVIMHYLGYDSGYRPGGQDATPWCPNGDGDAFSENYAEFVLSCRGQSVNNRPASDRADGIDRDFTNTYGDWFAFNFGDKDRYYYRGAYMDCVRAIDFMASRETSDMTNLYAEGQSQGGAFTYAAAALSGREFKAIAPGIAFMGDFPDYFELANWPAYVARENQGEMTDGEMYAFLSYFDTKNLATLISNKTAVIATIGVQDNVCPPHTNIAPYNNLADGTEKQMIYNPENAHQVGNTWYNDYMTFFAGKYVEPQDESSVQPLAEGETRVLFEDAEGVAIAWNEICQKEADWGAILEAGESFIVTVKTRDNNCEWPKVILRDATSTEAAAVELADVTAYPYIVKMTLTDATVLQLRNGFRFSGDGITITKIELSKPAAPQAGDISISAMNWFRTASYDADLYLVTTTERWGQAGWEVGDDRYADKTLVIVNIEATTFPVTLKMEYINTDNIKLATSVGVAAGKTQINLPLPLDTKIINKVYLTYAEPASVVLTDAAIVAAANARPNTGEVDATGIETIDHPDLTVDKCYDLQGRLLSKGKLAKRHMPKGLFIVNGKKVMIQ